VQQTLAKLSENVGLEIRTLIGFQVFWLTSQQHAGLRGEGGFTTDAEALSCGNTAR
jgi:hypothetical protein